MDVRAIGGTALQTMRQHREQEEKRRWGYSVPIQKSLTQIDSPATERRGEGKPNNFVPQSQSEADRLKHYGPSVSRDVSSTFAWNACIIHTYITDTALFFTRVATQFTDRVKKNARKE